MPEPLFCLPQLLASLSVLGKTRAGRELAAKAAYAERKAGKQGKQEAALGMAELAECVYLQLQPGPLPGA